MHNDFIKIDSKKGYIVMESKKIHIKNVTKIIKKRKVLDDISYEFKKGKIYGLCGPNGSGKTMILRLIAGLIIPTKGTVEIDGQLLHKDISFPPKIGLIIEHMELLPQYTAFENLKLLAQINHIAGDEEILDVLKRVELDSNLPVKKYSLGMNQRLNIAQAIFEKPEIILLDEPTNALDENGVKMVHKILREEKERGACIIMATHNKDDISDVCDEVLQMYEGKIKESTM